MGRNVLLLPFTLGMELCPIPKE